jgi:uncharacterized OB-fold protein
MKTPELVVKRWYEALDEGKILAKKCTRCGAYEFPPLYCCNSCSGSEMEWAEISGDAQVTEFVLPGAMNSIPEYDHLRPYVIGVVELKEGPSLRTTIRGISKENEKEIKAKLPFPVQPEVVQMEGYKTVMFSIKK